MHRLKNIISNNLKTQIPDFIATPASEFLWYQSLKQIDPTLQSAETDPSKLRLILGLARSGTTWVARVLAETSTPIRFVEEPLPRLRPKINPFCHPVDPSALGYAKTLSPNHPLIQSYEILTVNEYDWEKIKLKPQVKRDDNNWELCLVKEVHALLVTEALLNWFKIPCVIITRNPLYSIDSLFYRDGERSPYLYLEKKKLHHRKFLSQISPLDVVNKVTEIQKKYSKTDRQSMIVQQLLVQALIQKLLIKLAQNIQNSKLIKYENICYNPYEVFSEIFNFLHLAWDQKSKSFLDSTLHKKEKKQSSNYLNTISRDTKTQVNRKFKFLTSEEVDLCKTILEEIKFNQFS